MKKSSLILIGVIVVIGFVLFISFRKPQNKAPSNTISQNTNGIISGSFDKSKEKSDAEWKKILSPEQYNILRQAGTEIPFTGALDHETRPGTYYSVGCNEPVFRSEQKYDSGTGWPSFWAPIKPDALVLKKDNSIPGEERIEVLDKCGGHLGHVFDDGPTVLPDGRQATGKRYCMNSVALKFVPDKTN
ncbi:MAG TPA: peptide-methionine (R)-S-oxide reductase MsrB [Patescibacteria group bacterium]|nr:peptide-methionine (R)-S-oxide reductase MsrB [Patescibacteria group bacterium]